MRLLESASKFRLAMLLGSATGLALGCTFTLGDGSSRNECGGAFSNSEPQDDGTCACDAGYDWCNPSDADDFECCQLDACESGSNNYASGEDCLCDAGYDWCTNDPNDLNCCADPTGETGEAGEAGEAEATGDGDGDSSTTGDGDGDNLPPETCTAEEEGLEWCTKDVGDNYAGSRYFFCLEGMWVEFPDFLDEYCVDEGSDFSLGCGFNGTNNEIFCASGPGTACNSADAASCLDDTVIQECSYERLIETDCQNFCENGSQNGLGEDFEVGECEVLEGAADCTCSNP